MTTIDGRGAILDQILNVGNDHSFALTVLENASPYSFTGATVLTAITNESGTVQTTNWAQGIVSNTVTLTLDDAATAALGVGGWRYSVRVTKAGITSSWVAGKLTIRPITEGSGSTNATATLSITTAPGVTLDIAAATSQSYTDEMARDAIGAALVAGSGMTVTVDDAANTITLVSSGGGGGSGANLTYTASPTQGVVVSDTGTDATLPAATGVNAGLLLPADFTKLAGIEAGATADQTAAEILTAIKTVDGAGSGLDADLLDGISSAGFDAAGVAASAVATHEADTTSVHGIADTSTLYRSGGTDVAVADGGTGSSTAATARTALGVDAAGILSLLLTVDGAASGLDADLLDGSSSAAFLKLVAAGAAVEDLGAVESNVNTVAATGSTETLDTSVYGVHDCTMDQSCTFTFSNPAPSGKLSSFVLVLRGAFTPTFPAAVKWSSGAAPTYTTPSIYTFTTVDAGTTWYGAQVGKAFA